MAAGTMTVPALGWPDSPDVGIDGDGPDLAAAEQAAAAFIDALGLPIDEETRRHSPRRMAQAYAELFSVRPFSVTTFPNEAGFDGLVQARTLPLRSVCQHHLMPFAGVADVGYIPGERIVGISKLARIVQHFSARPQVQERLTAEIANFLELQLRPAGVGVVIRAEHTCMTMRGVVATGSETVTSVFRGLLAGGEFRREFAARDQAR